MSGSNKGSGTKVTDPSAIKRENPGPITSDSLAAESEGFSENPNSTPLSVTGANSTFNTTNTSGATRLEPAPDAEARKAEEDWAAEKQYGANATSYQTNPPSSKKTGEYSTIHGSGQSAGEAPSYVNSQFVDVAGPKGKNLTEGGFTSDDKKNASFNSEIGGKNDPGRAAEAKMFRENAGPRPPAQEGGTGENLFEELGRDESA